MNTRNTNFLLVSLIILTIIAGTILLPLLPEEIASHWNAQGEVDDYMPKFFGVFLFPAIMVFFYILYAIIPRIEPMKANLESFRKSYNMIWIILSLFLVYIFTVIMTWNLGWKLDIVFFMAPGLAVLFYAIGALLGKTKRNWFVGIRTPWTLSSDEVWEKTHRLGAKLFKITAGVVFISMFFEKELMVWFIIVPTLVATLITVIYSFLEYRKQTNR